MGPSIRTVPDQNQASTSGTTTTASAGVTVDLDSTQGQEHFRRLAQEADVILETKPPSYMKDRELAYSELQKLNHRLVFARISPFGDEGPWANYKGSDLIHLALGGVVMNCGYDPQPDGFYDTPPVAPQMWQAYHIAGELAAIGIMAALFYARDTGSGQYVSTAVHEAVAKQTEGDLPDWIYYHRKHWRATCRHSMSRRSDPPRLR